MREQDYKASVNKLINSELTFSERLGNWGAGLCGESAEVDTVIGDASFIDSIDRTKFIDEMSDCRWYVTAFTIDLNLPEWWIRTMTNTPIPDSLQQQSRLLMRYAGNVDDIVKKVIYHKHPLEQHWTQLVDKLEEYLRIYYSLLYRFDVSDNQVKTYNYEKLNARYKNLKFTTEQSLNRNNELSVATTS